MVVTTKALPPRTPVTIRAALSTPEPDRVTVPWPIQYDMVLGRWPVLALVLAALAVVALVVARLWAARAREEEPGYPVMYAPPDGMGPVQSYFIAAEGVPDNGAGRVAALHGRARPGAADRERSRPTGRSRASHRTTCGRRSTR